MEEILEQIKNIIDQKISDEFNPILHEKGPLMIHQAFCMRLGNIVQKNPEKLPKDIPDAVKVLNAIEVLEDIYTELKK